MYKLLIIFVYYRSNVIPLYHCAVLTLYLSLIHICEGLYWNYWYHVWKTFSVSPFSNNAVFVAGTPDVKSVAVTPSKATVSAGGQIQLSVTVDTDNYAPQSVIWSIATGGDKASISSTGMLKINSGAEAGTITVKATSTFDSTKSGTATITVA